MFISTRTLALVLFSIVLLPPYLIAAPESTHNDFDQLLNQGPAWPGYFLYPESFYRSAHPITITHESAATVAAMRTKKTPNLVMVYMAADNELRPFSLQNIRQLSDIGSNEFVTILVHLDIFLPGKQKTTRRYLIERNNILHLNADDPLTQQMDSGDPKTLISFCSWAIKNFPAQNHILVMWDHGTGILDPSRRSMLNTSELFYFNPHINKLQLDRSIGFLDITFAQEPCYRGVCWDNTTGNFLTHKKLAGALQEITTLLGKKFDLLCFDMCLMNMIEVANLIKPYATIMVGSQEVELGTGWDYSKALAPLKTAAISPEQLAINIVNAYEKTYQSITNDYTQSAIHLDSIEYLEKNIDTVANLLIACLKNQQGTCVRDTLRTCRSKNLCTHFDIPSYLDLHHLYSNILDNSKRFILTNNLYLIDQLKDGLITGKKIIETVAFANVAGANLKRARGISIYFPERGIDPSYQQSPFAKSNAWSQFLGHYLFG